MKVKFEELESLFRAWHANNNAYFTGNFETDTKPFLDSVGWTLSEIRKVSHDISKSYPNERTYHPNR